MRARELRHLCRSLPVVAALVGTLGPALAQSPGEGQPADAPAHMDFAAPHLQELLPELPQFLDEQRLPELHRAWRQRASGDGMPVGEEAAEETAMSAARAGMQRRKEAVQQAPEVRERAEALSRLFGATEPPAETVAESASAPRIAPAAAAPTTITTATTTPADAAAAKPAVATNEVPVAPEAPKARTATAMDETPLDPPYGVGGPMPDKDELAPTGTGPVQTGADATGSGVTETGALGPSAAEPQSERSTAKTPPLPERAPQTAPRTTVRAPAPSTQRTVTATPRRPKPNPAEIFPQQLRSFGWNTQPD